MASSQAPPPPSLDALGADVVRAVLDLVGADNPASVARLLAVCRAPAGGGDGNSPASLLLREAADDGRWRSLFARRFGEPGGLSARAASAVGSYRRLFGERLLCTRLAAERAQLRNEAGLYEDDDAAALSANAAPSGGGGGGGGGGGSGGANDHDELEAWLLARRRLVAQAAAATASMNPQAHPLPATGAPPAPPSALPPPPPPGGPPPAAGPAAEAALRERFLASRRARTVACKSELEVLLEAIARVPPPPPTRPSLEAPSAAAAAAAALATAGSSDSPLPPLMLRAPMPTTTLRVVFLVDGSGSVTKREFDRAREFVLSAVDVLEHEVEAAAPAAAAAGLGEEGGGGRKGPAAAAAEITVVQFSSSASVEGTAVLVSPAGTPPFTPSSRASAPAAADPCGSALRARVRRMGRMAGGTNAALAVRAAAAVFAQAPALDLAAVGQARLAAAAAKEAAPPELKAARERLEALEAQAAGARCALLLPGGADGTQAGEVLAGAGEAGLTPAGADNGTVVAAAEAAVARAREASAAAERAAAAAAEGAQQALVKATAAAAAARAAVSRRVIVLMTDGRIGEPDALAIEQGLERLAREEARDGGGGAGAHGAPIETFVVGFSSRFDVECLAAATGGGGDCDWVAGAGAGEGGDGPLSPATPAGRPRADGAPWANSPASCASSPASSAGSGSCASSPFAAVSPPPPPPVPRCVRLTYPILQLGQLPRPPPPPPPPPPAPPAEGAGPLV